MTWKNYLPGLSLTIYRLTRTRPRWWSLGAHPIDTTWSLPALPLILTTIYIVKILGICLDNKLSFREHISIMLKKVYSKIGTLRRLKRLVPTNTMLLLYKSFVLSHFEYCNSLLVGIGKTLNKKLEDANYYGLWTIMKMGKSTDYESILRMADMNTLEHRTILNDIF